MTLGLGREGTYLIRRIFILKRNVISYFLVFYNNLILSSYFLNIILKYLFKTFFSGHESYKLCEFFQQIFRRFSIDLCTHTFLWKTLLSVMCEFSPVNIVVNGIGSQKGLLYAQPGFQHNFFFFLKLAFNDIYLYYKKG